VNLYAYGTSDPVDGIDPTGLLVQAAYDQATGILTVQDESTGANVSILAESGGKPWGDSIPNGTYEILARDGRPGFYRLDSLDANPGDDVDQRTGRSHFRLHHPGRTIGCIAAQTQEGWDQVQTLIDNTNTSTVMDHISPPWWDPFGWFHPDTPITFYGTLTVTGSQ
jgi:hypothetical protein